MQSISKRSRFELPSLKKERMDSSQSKIIQAMRSGVSPKIADYTNSVIEKAISRTFQAIDPSEHLLKRISLSQMRVNDTRSLS